MSFIKRCQSNSALKAEVHGLTLLRLAITKHGITELNIPDVIGQNGCELTMDRINAVQPTEQHYDTLAKGLANLHRINASHFGLERHNFIGLSPQQNALFQDWGAFFIHYRLLPQIGMMQSSSEKQSFLRILDKSEDSLAKLLNNDSPKPALLHGDLWCGNVMFSAQSRVWLIDPAVYYGDREADIAMTELFGGFPNSFYDSYNTHFPLSAEYATKREIYNLYHNLNHLNLFGDSYLYKCVQTFDLISQL